MVPLEVVLAPQPSVTAAAWACIARAKTVLQREPCHLGSLVVFETLFPNRPNVDGYPLAQLFVRNQLPD
jgi:hypothetical protein